MKTYQMNYNSKLQRVVDLTLDTLTEAVRKYIQNLPTGYRTSFCLLVGQQRWRLSSNVPHGQPGAKVGITSANNQSPPQVVAARLLADLED